MRKPVPHALSSEEHRHLVNFQQGGLMRSALSPEVESRLVESGYLKRGIGGHVVTNAGLEAIYGREEK